MASVWFQTFAMHRDGSSRSNLASQPVHAGRSGLRIALFAMETAKRGGAALNRDVAGGYGTVSDFGPSLRSRFLTRLKGGGVNCPNISLAYLAAIFRRAGHEVTLCAERLPDPGTDLCLIHASIVDWKREVAWARQIRATGVPVGLMGPFAGAKPELFADAYDLLIRGEPEGWALEFAASGSSPRGIVESPIVHDLDVLPFPEWDLFPIERYSYFPTIRAKPFLPVLSSRGCSFSCGYYCPYVAYEGARWRGRSASRVVEELERLVIDYGVRGVVFRDPLFTARKARVVEIAEGIRRLPVRVEWACETHLNTLDEPLIAELAGAGLRTINVGIESSDAEVLSQSKRKGTSVETQKRLIRYCESKGVNVTGYYILGMQGDTKDSILRTLAYARELNTLGAQFTISTPYPGTEFYEDIQGQIFETDFEKFDAYSLVFRHEHLSAQELAELKDLAFRSYYFRPRWMLKYAKHRLSGLRPMAR